MSEKLRSYEFWEKTLRKAKYVVAPMVDASELAWRMMSRRYGAELCYTPMYHAAVFSRDANYRFDALQSCPEDRPLIIQFCANDPQVFLDAAKLAEDHCDAIDLNLGCPQQIARRGHYGAFLQDDWDLLERMVSLCHEKLKVPITCKIRVYEDIEKTINYAKMLEKAGCQLLTVHGRTKEQKGMETGLASWKHIKAIRDNVSIPVFANGNIQWLADVEKCIKATDVDGVMIAEGSLHNPALFSGKQTIVWDMAIEYLDLVDQYPCPLSYIRGHLFKICHHAFHVHPTIREMLAVSKSVKEIRRSIELLKVTCQDDVERFEEHPEMLKTWELPLPYWICQPYVRPTKEEREKRQKEKRENLKRQLENMEPAATSNEPTEKLSKSKMKKLKKYPNKDLDKKISERAAKYVSCSECTNCKGMKCVFDLCKSCCKIKTHTDIVDCEGHNLLVKTKQERRIKWEERQKLENFQLPYSKQAGTEIADKNIKENNKNLVDYSESNLTDTNNDPTKESEYTNLDVDSNGINPAVNGDCN
ncbi:unnamed protein product [Owenia fusiformis]|uniref:tRNA-dihydrouridine(16/17) synthase [NAD(P)(+)]-like n=1 Tax=Owenia fusiformis TaxID=6347 RepID=A0A8J1XXZ4_OWEFU|nr:unnamed protein product [Owenia fusiformis]